MSAHLFSMTPRIEIPRSSFKRSHSYKTTMNAGKLVPFFFDDVIPGDTFNLRTNIFCRMATLISPIMDDLYIDTHYFFVPYRLVWNNFQKFMGEQDNPGDSIDYVIPEVFNSVITTSTEVEAESVMDYFGIPIGNFYGGYGNYCNISALPFRAYALIWDEWFRDENLQDSLSVNKEDNACIFKKGTSTSNKPYGDNGFDYFFKAGSCLPRGKIHDYFTSSLPWVLKDGSSVDVPLGGLAPVTGLEALSSSNGYFPVSDRNVDFTDRTYVDSGDVYHWPTQKLPSSGADPPAYTYTKNNLKNVASADSELVADLSQVYALTVNSLRESFQVQRFLERSARSGTRYTEILRGFFGTISPDARLQRPEYLGGTSSRLQVNVVPQTSESGSDTPQGNLAAFVTGVNSNKDGFTKSFVEHGMIIGLMSIRGPLLYQQGLNRYWSKRTRFDFYWPTFAHLGEQAVLNKEIFVQGTSDDDGVFGYQERYAEYRYAPSMITGKFRSTYSQPLDNWHLGQKFDSLPTLSNQFIQDNPPISRVVAVPSEPQFLVDVHFELNCARPMPLYGVPGLIDHF